MFRAEVKITPELAHTHTIIALEGAFGCGKTQVGNTIKDCMITTGQLTEMYKLGGLGDNQKWLKKIKVNRQMLHQTDQETQQQKLDRETDRIYHLAAVRQTRSILDNLSLLPEKTLILLDRTPFVGYAYSMALDEQNPYLETIYQQNLDVARRIGMHAVMLFDLPIEESYARTLARYLVVDADPLIRINKLLTRIEVPTQVVGLIRQRTIKLIQSGMIRPREFDDRHFISYKLAKRQRQTYQDALVRGQRDLGFNLTIINAEQSFDAVVTDTIREINRIQMSRKI